ncbi:ATP synthase subunit I [Megalodesulfovibrio paquesii]
MSRTSTLETLLQPWRAIRHGIESSLYHKGVRNASVRTLLTRQCLLAVIALVVGVAGGYFHPWLLHFAIGVGIVTANFYFLATSLARRLEAGARGPLVASMIFRFYGRLILTGVLLAILLVFGQISLAALLAGLSTVVATILIWGVESYLAQHSKEA